MMLKNVYRTLAVTAGAFMAGTLPAFADTTSSTTTTTTTATGFTNNTSQIITQAQAIYNELESTLHLYVIQAVIVLIIAGFAINKLFAASKDHNTKGTWMALVFGIIGIVVVIQPVLIIQIAAWFAGLF